MIIVYCHLEKIWSHLGDKPQAHLPGFILIRLVSRHICKGLTLIRDDRGLWD